MRITSDDVGFQDYLKQQLSYLMDRAQKCKDYVNSQLTSKKVAGFYSNNNQSKETLDYMR